MLRGLRELLYDILFWTTVVFVLTVVVTAGVYMGEMLAFWHQGRVLLDNMR